MQIRRIQKPMPRISVSANEKRGGLEKLTLIQNFYLLQIIVPKLIRY
jgi:hypothetical protein